MKKAKFIINPSSGRQNFLKNIEGMIGKLIMDQIVNHVDVFYTEKQDDAKNEAMSMKKGEYDFVVAIGGDGTLNEVVNGVALGKNETPIAVISAGTVNDFANYLSLPQGIDEFCDLIRDFNIKEVDLGRNHEPAAIKVCDHARLSYLAKRASVYVSKSPLRASGAFASKSP